jgi:hypothetical protein
VQCDGGGDQQFIELLSESFLIAQFCGRALAEQLHDFGLAAECQQLADFEGFLVGGGERVF